MALAISDPSRLNSTAIAMPEASAIRCSSCTGA